MGPKEDPARVKHLGKYKAQDVLKHLSLLEQPFVHPASGTELQTKINGLLQQAGLTVGDWYVEAADDGQQMLQTAQEKNCLLYTSKLTDPQFEGQTKTKLGNADIRGLVEGALFDGLSTFFEENPQVAKTVIQKCLVARRAREEARKAREMTLRKGRCV